MNEYKGLKYDEDKNRLGLIPVESLLELGKVYTYGAKKYSDESWKNVEPFEERYYDALLRHLFAWRGGERMDKESRLTHLSHAFCNLSFLVYKDFMDNKKDLDTI
jgi:hypothetical protein